jgi:LmbE family N-acetylglucosaminyl deacetylase
MAVFAHPDDESLACGGTLARLADGGARVVLVCATHGENGSVSDPSLVADANLGTVRATELRLAATVLGIRHLVILNHPDGELRWADVQAFRAEIIMTIERFRPEIVITFGEDGLYWHLDHIGVHERTTMAVRWFGVHAPALYYVTLPRGGMAALVGATRSRLDASAEPTLWGIEPDTFGEHAAPADFTIDVRPWTPRKVAALRCHRSQLGERHPLNWINDDDARQWLGVEQFRRAAIPGVATDLLEPLGEPVAR